MKTYRVAILGCRARGTATARAYHAHPRTGVVGLCDLKPELADTLGDELGVPARYTDLDEMVSDVAPDIVAIPTGTEFHFPLAMRVLEYGVHIDIEKPLCLDLAQADQVIALAREKGVKIAVHHQQRSGAAVRALWKAYQAGKIGEVLFVQGSGKGYYGGYGLMNIGTHTLNCLLKFAGHARRVSAVALTDGMPVTPRQVVPSPSGMGTICGEHITATFQFDKNVTGVLTQHRFPKVNAITHGFQVFGTEGRLLMMSNRAWVLNQPHFLPDGSHDQWETLPLEPLEGFDSRGTASEIEYSYVDDYVRALDSNGEHQSSGHEARHIMEIMMGIFESAAYGKSIQLPQEKRDHPLLRWRVENGLDVLPEMPRNYGDWLRAEDARLGRA